MDPQTRIGNLDFWARGVCCLGRLRMNYMLLAALHESELPLWFAITDITICFIQKRYFCLTRTRCGTFLAMCFRFSNNTPLGRQLWHSWQRLAFSLKKNTPLRRGLGHSLQVLSLSKTTSLFENKHFRMCLESRPENNKNQRRRRANETTYRTHHSRVHY